MLQIWYIITFIRGTNLRYQFKKKSSKVKNGDQNQKSAPLNKIVGLFEQILTRLFFALHKNLEIKCNSPVVPFHGILPFTATIKRFQFLRPFNGPLRKLEKNLFCFSAELNTKKFCRVKLIP